MRSNYFKHKLKILTTGSGPIRLAFILAVTLAFARALFHAHITDLGTADEAGYLWEGINFFHSVPPPGESGPLYVLWYWLESCFVSDPILLYQLNWGILLFVILILLIVALRSVGVSITGICLVISWASSAYYFDVWPYVTMFSAALVLLAAIISLRVDSPAPSYAVTATILAMSVFVRPELLLAFLFILAVAGFYSYRNREYRLLILPVIIFLLLCFTFGLPFGGGRSMVAFGQHYAMNIVNSRHLDVDPWNNYLSFVKADFGDVSTPFQAFLANPQAFLSHIFINVRNLINGAVLIGPYFITRFGNLVRLFGCLLLVVGVGFCLMHFKKDEKCRRLIILLAALIVPCLISVLLIAPRLHYFMAPIAAACVCAGFGLSRTRFNFPMAALSLTPLPIIFLAISWFGQTPETPILATVQLLRTLVVPPQGSLLKASFGRAVYANLNYVRIDQITCDPFKECLKDRRPTIIVSDDLLRAHYAKDQGFQALVEQPAIEGYDFIHVPDTKVDIYVSHN